MTAPLQPARIVRVGIMDLDFTAMPILMRATDEDNSPWKWVDKRDYETRQETLPPTKPGDQERTVCIQCTMITFDDGTERFFNPADEVEIGLISSEIS
jgi:hypothetical protein